MEEVHKKLLLDKEDKHILKEHSFYFVGANNNKYPATEIKKKTVYLHHFILPKKEGFEIDHINRDVMDNRRENLRYVTSSQNGMNRGMMKNNTSGYRGVSWSKSSKKWLVRIKLNGESIRLGYFDDIEEAAKAYKKKALELFEQYLGETSNN